MSTFVWRGFLKSEQNEQDSESNVALDKASFQHGMAYADFKDLPWTIIAGKVLLDKAFRLAKNRKYDRYRHGIASMVYSFFDKKHDQTP